MTRKMDYRWLLRERMAERGMWKTTDLAPLLADRGIHLSAAQVYRLVSGTPERLSLPILVALCDILSCTPNDLIVPRVETVAKPRKAAGGDLPDDVLDLNRLGRPRRARITPESQ
jgi:DNA-binding Xre family transcriptional regulator